MLYFCFVNRKLRSYFSITLAVCLLIQSGIYGLIHMYEHDHSIHHHDHHFHSVSSHDLEEDVHNQCEYHASHDEDHNYIENNFDSKFNFDELHVCGGCELLKALDKQNFASTALVDIAFYSSPLSAQEVQLVNRSSEVLFFTQDRAPPFA